MVRSMWWSGRDSETTCWRCMLTKAMQWTDHDSTPIVWLGINQHTICSLHLLQFSRLRRGSQEPGRMLLQNQHHTWHEKAPSFVPVSRDRIEVKPFWTWTTSKEEFLVVMMYHSDQFQVLLLAWSIISGGWPVFSNWVKMMVLEWL